MTKPIAKATKMMVQYGIGIHYLDHGLDQIVKWSERVQNNENSIRDFVGNAGYTVAQVGMPTLSVLVAAYFGYICVKGAGMFFDKHYYKNEDIPSIFS